jgi:hypothetical protein
MAQAISFPATIPQFLGSPVFDWFFYQPKPRLKHRALTEFLASRRLKLNADFQLSQLSASSFGLLTFIQYNLALELHAFKSGMRT